MWRIGIVFFVLAVSDPAEPLSLPAWAQPASTPQPPDLSLPDTMKLSPLVDLAGEVSGVAYSYNPQSSSRA